MITLDREGTAMPHADGRCSYYWRRRSRLLRRTRIWQQARPQSLSSSARASSAKAARLLFAGNLVISGRLLGNKRGAGTQHRRIPYQVPQPVSHRSGVGAPVRPAWIEERLYYPELEELGTLL